MAELFSWSIVVARYYDFFLFFLLDFFPFSPSPHPPGPCMPPPPALTYTPRGPGPHPGHPKGKFCFIVYLFFLRHFSGQNIHVELWEGFFDKPLLDTWNTVKHSVHENLGLQNSNLTTNTIQVFHRNPPKGHVSCVSVRVYVWVSWARASTKPLAGFSSCVLGDGDNPWGGWSVLLAW